MPRIAAVRADVRQAVGCLREEARPATPRRFAPQIRGGTGGARPVHRRSVMQRGVDAKTLHQRLAIGPLLALRLLVGHGGDGGYGVN